MIMPCVIIFVGILLYYGLALPGCLQITHHDVYVKGLPKAFEGLTIVQLSDIHQNIWTRPGRVRQIVKQVNAMHPDITLLTGDYISKGKANIDPVGKALFGLKAKYGVYAVLGNHDYWTDGPHMAKALRGSGIDVLINENRRIVAGKDHIWLAGFDDIWAGNPDYERGLAGVPTDDFCIAMAHNPDAALALGDTPVSFLMSGHMHGGVINLPKYGSIFKYLWHARFISGLYKVGHLQLYVSSGIGDNLMAIRFRCHTELPVFVLHGTN